MQDLYRRSVETEQNKHGRVSYNSTHCKNCGNAKSWLLGQGHDVASNELILNTGK